MKTKCPATVNEQSLAPKFLFIGDPFVLWALSAIDRVLAVPITFPPLVTKVELGNILSLKGHLRMSEARNIRGVAARFWLAGSYG